MELKKMFNSQKQLMFLLKIDETEALDLIASLANQMLHGNPNSRSENCHCRLSNFSESSKECYFSIAVTAPEDEID